MATVLFWLISLCFLELKRVTASKVLRKIKEEGLYVIGMVKDVKQKYTFENKEYSLKEVRKLLSKRSPSNILGSIIVTTKNGSPVKLVYVKNGNKQNEWLAILCIDLSISNEEIVRIYGNRWTIQVFFKSIKSFLKLGN
ncbi:hypothetical protein [Alkaliphilus metalliredigens]|uniref:hypothetical protein n=1 Tax=Alkaliphilus metalliredigens TaxID=208226 RepID=UPI0012ED3066|nr:hypothetical protein [Alkaliphilus metalliredigens]